MPKRRANGEGNIRKRKDGRWEGRYTVGHDPETGKAIIKNVLGKTQAEVKEKLKKAIEENVGIDYGRAKTYTVGTWLEVWMENYAKVKLRPSTFKTSQGFLKNHIKPQIGGIPLAELTSLDLQRFYKHLLDGGRVDRVEAKKKPKGLAPKTVRNIHQMIGSAYNLAMPRIARRITKGLFSTVENSPFKTPRERKGLPPLDPRTAVLDAHFGDHMRAFSSERFGVLLFPLSRCCGASTAVAAKKFEPPQGQRPSGHRRRPNRKRQQKMAGISLRSACSRSVASLQ